VSADVVLWHDLECGGYAEDLPLWHELAQREGGPILDVGAGTGRVTLELARAGHAVVALDVEPVLLAALRERAGDLPVETVRADARAFALERRFPLVLAPMQTVQLLGGAAERAAFLRCAVAHLAPGGLLACALADALDGFDGEEEGAALPLPDVLERDGWVYASQPVAVRPERHWTVIERIRQAVAPDGRRSAEGDVIHLDRLDGDGFEAEGVAAGLQPAGRRFVEMTDAHVGSEVVLLRA